MTFQITRIASRAELAHLQAEWEELQADSQSQSVFLSWEWVSAYLHYLNPEAELWILLARDRDQHLLGLAPLMLEKVQLTGPLRARRLQFIALEYDKHCTSFIIRKGCEEVVIAAFIAWLREHRVWDDVLLEGIPAESPVTDALIQSGPSWIKLESHDYPYVSTTQSWEAHYASLSKSKREAQRRARRKLDADFPDQWSWKRIEDPAELPVAMDRLMDLHQQKWVTLGEDGHYRDEQSRAFHHHIARRFLERGWLRLYQLTIKGEVVSADYAFAYMGRIYGYARAMDDAYRPYALGNVLTEIALREAFEEGMTEFGLLWGAHEYKLRWGSEIRGTLVLSWPTAPLMLLYRHGYQVARELWIRAKGVFRADKQAWMQAILPLMLLWD